MSHLQGKLITLFYYKFCMIAAYLTLRIVEGPFPAAYNRINVINSPPFIRCYPSRIPRVQKRAELTDNAGTDGVPHAPVVVRPENDYINSE